VLPIVGCPSTLFGVLFLFVRATNLDRMCCWIDGGALGSSSGALSSTMTALTRRIPLLIVAGLGSTVGFFILVIKSLAVLAFSSPSFHARRIRFRTLSREAASFARTYATIDFTLAKNLSTCSVVGL
jgi:hypothetical protein